MKTKRRFRWGLFALVLAGLVAVGGFVLWLFLNKPKPIPPEKLVRVERGNIARSVVAIGHVEALSKVAVKSKANGIIQALLVDAGDKVMEGQVLAELDKENPQALLREAKATVDGEEANLLMAQAAESKAKIEAVNPELDFALREFERTEKLFAQGIASQQALDDTKKAHEIAVNRRQLLEAVAHSAQAQVTQARARVAAARAALDRADENLRNSTIRSPIGGIVLTRDTEVGDAVSSILNLGSAATLIMTLGDMSSVYVKGEIDEADVGKIHTNMPVRIKVESFAGEPFKGTVTRIAPMGREKDNVRTFEVRVSIANPEGKLRVNMSANAEIVLEEKTGVLLIPEAAIVYDRDGKPSLQKRDASAKTGYVKTPVKTGVSNGQKTELTEGLKEGEELVLP
jgi:HlyD family secretion protein